ncbi:hypothetical protein Brsp05_04097 [Brucella sp. NBRC 12953]
MGIVEARIRKLNHWNNEWLNLLKTAQRPFFVDPKQAMPRCVFRSLLLNRLMNSKSAIY